MSKKHFTIKNNIVLPEVEHSAREMLYWGGIKINEVQRLYTISNDCQIKQCDCRIVEVSDNFSDKVGRNNLKMQIRYDGSDKWIDRWFTQTMAIASAQVMMIAEEVGNELYEVQKKYNDIYMKMIDVYNEEISK